MSHHSDGGGPFDEERQKQIQEILKNHQRELEGEFPHGRATSDDQGALAWAVGSDPKNGIVRLDFPKPVKWVGMQPQQAMDLAKLLVEHARRASKAPIIFEIG